MKKILLGILIFFIAFFIVCTKNEKTISYAFTQKAVDEMEVNDNSISFVEDNGDLFDISLTGTWYKLLDDNDSFILVKKIEDNDYKINVLDISIHDENEFGIFENDELVFLKIVYEYNGNQKYRVKKVVREQLEMDSIVNVKNDSDKDLYSKIYRQSMIDYELGLRLADVPTKYSTEKFDYDYYCSSDNCIDKYFGPTIYNEDQFAFRTDDSIVNIIPKQLFFMVGTHQYCGIEYGFFIETVANYSNSGEIVYDSLVAVFDIENTKEIVTIDKYSNGELEKKENRITMKYTLDFVYSYRSITRSGYKWNSYVYNEKLDKIVLGKEENHICFIDNIIAFVTPNDSDNLKIDDIESRFGFNFENTSTFESFDCIAEVLSLSLKRGSIFSKEIGVISKLYDVGMGLYDLYKKFDAMNEPMETYISNQNTVEIIQIIKQQFSEILNSEDIELALCPSTISGTEELKSDIKRTITKGNLGFTATDKDIRSLLKYPNIIDNLKKISTYLEMKFYSYSRNCNNSFNIDGYLFLSIDNKCYPILLEQKNILLSQEDYSTQIIGNDNTFHLCESNNYNVSFRLKGNGSSFLTTEIENRKLIDSDITVSIYETNMAYTDKSRKYYFTGTNQNSLLPTLNVHGFIRLSSLSYYIIEIQGEKETDLTGKLKFNAFGDGIDKVSPKYDFMVNLSNSQSTYIFSCKNDFSKENYQCYESFVTIGAYSQNEKNLSIEVFDSYLRRIGYNTLGLYNEEDDDPCMDAYLQDILLLKEQYYFVVVSVSHNLTGDSIQIQNQMCYRNL